MVIRSAINEDEKYLKLLWTDCFQDPIEYVDFYFKYRFRSNFCAVLEINNEIVGMIHLLPCKIEPDQKAMYWYAAGIRSDKRKQGLFRKFAIHVKESINQLGYQNICVPAEGLESVYLSLGFENAYTAKDLIFRKKEEHDKKSNDARIEQAKAKDFYELATKKGDTLWDMEAISYAIQENLLCDGKVLKIYNGETIFVCFAIRKDENMFLIDYQNFNFYEFELIKNALFEFLQCKTLILRIAGKDKIVGLTDSKFITENSKITMTLA